MRGAAWTIALAPLLTLGLLAATPAAQLPRDEVQPGKADPAPGIAAAAYELSWDGRRTLVVVGPSAGRVAPAWVVSYGKPEDANGLMRQGGINGMIPADPPVVGPQDVVAAYRATAFRDADGNVHIDARGAQISGGLYRKGGWVPDCFLLLPNQTLRTTDFQDNAETRDGSILRSIPLRTAPADYLKLLPLAQRAVQDAL